MTKLRAMMLISLWMLVPVFAFAQTQPEVYDPQVYEGIYPDLNTYGGDTSALQTNWLNQGLPAGRRASFIFDPVYYTTHNSGVPSGYSAALQDFMTNGLPAGKRGSLEFDVKYYLAKYADLKAAYGTNYLAAADHFLNQGLPCEGRQGSADFAVQDYIGMYPDVAAGYPKTLTCINGVTDFKQAALQWLRRGKGQGRHGFGFLNPSTECSSAGQGIVEFGTVPAAIPFTISVSNPSGFQDVNVFYLNPPPGFGPQLTSVASSPGQGQYSVSAGVYTFSSADKEQPMQITYNMNAVPTGYQRIYFADPSVFHGSFGDGSSASSPMRPDSVSFSSHTVAFNLDYQLRCRSQGGSDCVQDGIIPATLTPPEANIIVCLEPGHYLTDGEFDWYFDPAVPVAGKNQNFDTKSSFKRGFTLGPNWRVHGYGANQTTIQLNDVELASHVASTAPYTFPHTGSGCDAGQPDTGFNVVFGTTTDHSDGIEISDLLIDGNYPALKQEYVAKCPNSIYIGSNGKQLSQPLPLSIAAIQLRSDGGEHNVHNINVLNMSGEIGGIDIKYEFFVVDITSAAGTIVNGQNVPDDKIPQQAPNNQIKYVLMSNFNPIPSDPAGCTAINIANVMGEVAYNVANSWNSIRNNFGQCQGFGGFALSSSSFHDNIGFNNSNGFLTDSDRNRGLNLQFNQFTNPTGIGIVVGGGGEYDYYTIQYNIINLSQPNNIGILLQGNVHGASINNNTILVAGTPSGVRGIGFLNNGNFGNNFQYNQISSSTVNDTLPATNCAFDNLDQFMNPVPAIPDTQGVPCATPPQAYATMTTDGDFVVVGPASAALWATNTSAPNGNIIVMQNDGNLVVYQFVWQAGTYAAGTPGPYPPQTCSIAGGDTLGAGETLYENQCIVSASGQYILFLASNGSLYIYDIAHNTAPWGVFRNDPAGNGDHAAMQTDGNFVLYSGAGVPLWASNTNGTGATALRMESDGRIIIYMPHWSSQTNQPVIPAPIPHPQPSECTDVGEGTGSTGVLPPTNCFVSVSGAYEVIMEADGSLVLYDRSVTPHKPLWSNFY